MKRQIVFITTVIALVLTNGLYGLEQPIDLNAPAELEDYLAFAAMNNAGLQVAFEQWKIAVEQVPQAKSLPDPKFTYGYFIEEVETRVGPQRNRLEIMQTFPWFGEIEARKDAAAAAAKAARKRYEAAKLKLFAEVKDAFYEYTYLARAIEIAKENLELIQHFEEVARTKYMAAATGHPDVIHAQIELARLEDRLKTLEELRKPIVARLNSVLNRQSLEMLPWPRKAEFRAAQLSRGKKKDTENTIIARAERALYDFQDSDRKRKLYGDILIPKAEELLGASETAYKAGTIDFLSLINAQQKLLEFQLYYEKATIDNQQDLAMLEMLVGTEL